MSAVPSAFSCPVFQMNTKPSVSLGELARFYIRLSLTAFGGPVAHLALAEQEIVTRRQWLTREHFLDLIAAVNLIPGPSSTQVMIHVGYALRGIRGALVCGLCFIIPAFLVTLALAVLYVSTGNLPLMGAILWGIKPVIVAIIANAGYHLVPTALKTRVLWALFVLSLIIIEVANIPAVLVMVTAGALYALYQTQRLNTSGALLATMALPSLWQTAVQIVPVTVWDIFFYFLKIGSVLFGSGYILIAYIQQDLVNNFHWVSARQLLDAVAIGQLTPGPVSTTSAVIGYIVAGFPGAIMATVGIFLPSFVLVILTAPLIPKMRQSKALRGFLAGVNTAVLAVILVTVIDLTRAALLTPDGAQISLIAIAVGVGALGALVWGRVNPTWLIVVGAVVGLVAGR